MENKQDLNSNNELDNIILDKSSSSLKNKKIILSVATLAVVLIVVVVIMNKITTNDENALPKPILPPKNDVSVVENDDTLFKPVDVIEEESGDNLDKIAQKLKEESLLEDKFVNEEDIVVIDEPVPTHKEKIVNNPVRKVAPKKVEEKKSVAPRNFFFIQVGSFSRYEPNKKFLKSITKLGYKYEYKKVRANGKTLNKVLVGPFKSEKEARENLPKIRKYVVSGAFLTKG